MKGRHVSEENKIKFSILYTGKKQSPETIEKKIKNRKGYKHSKETKEKIGKANSKPSIFKGKTYEEIMGEERAKERSKKQSISMKGKNKIWTQARRDAQNNKNKFFIEENYAI